MDVGATLTVQNQITNTAQVPQLTENTSFSGPYTRARDERVSLMVGRNASINGIRYSLARVCESGNEVLSVNCGTHLLNVFEISQVETAPTSKNTKPLLQGPPQKLTDSVWFASSRPNGKSQIW